MAKCSTGLFLVATLPILVLSQHAFRATGAGAEFARVRTEITALLGHAAGSKTERLERIQGQLLPMYDALPKNEDGSLEIEVARYALHRFFVQQHGWRVSGLSSGEGQTSITAMFAQRVPTYLFDLLEKRFSGRKLVLHDLAVLAATQEDLVHGEVIEIVSRAFFAQNVSLHSQLTAEMEQRIMETFMLFHLVPSKKVESLSTEKLNRVIKRAPKFCFAWEDNLLWAKDLQSELAEEGASEENPFVGTPARDFDSFVSLVERVGEKHGQFQSIECRTLKHALLDLEDRGTGRVSLAKFYTPAAASSEKHHPFTESADYLKHLGALDDTDPSNPRVIITNYLLSQSNCVAASRFYSVCCINECEKLMSKLELSLAAPHASPEEIVRLVASLPSDTVSSPRNISDTLVKRLQSVADRHDGFVPIHGRLFAQWMHHAYPNECPFPHAKGTVDAHMRPSEWASKVSGDSNKKSYLATKEDMAYRIEASQEHSAMLDVDIQWTEEEELVAPVTGVSVSRTRLGLRLAVLMLAASSAIVAMGRMLRSSRDTLPMRSKRVQSGFWSKGSFDASKPHFV